MYAENESIFMEAARIPCYYNLISRPSIDISSIWLVTTDNLKKKKENTNKFVFPKIWLFKVKCWSKLAKSKGHRLGVTFRITLGSF